MLSFCVPSLERNGLAEPPVAPTCDVVHGLLYAGLSLAAIVKLQEYYNFQRLL